MASIPPLNLRATTADDSGATAATGFEGSVRLSILQSIRKYGTRAEGMSFRLHHFVTWPPEVQTPFLNFQTITPTSHPFGPIVGGRRMEEGGCECHVRRGVVR